MMAEEREMVKKLMRHRKKTVRKQRAEEDGRRERIYILCKEEDGMASLTISPRPFNYSCRIPLTPPRCEAGHPPHARVQVV
jgi:hypothetical protein